MAQPTPRIDLQRVADGSSLVRAPVDQAEPEDDQAFGCGERSVIHVYLSHEHARTSTATLAGWCVEWGGKTAYFEDPDGNILSVASRSLDCGRSRQTRENVPGYKATPSDGTAVALDRSGDGPMVIYVGRAFNYVLAGVPHATLLAPYFTVFNYDRLGRGDRGDMAPFAVEREVDDLDALIGEADGSALIFEMTDRLEEPGH